VSRKITDEEERRRLKTVLKEFRQERGRRAHRPHRRPGREAEPSCVTAVISPHLGRGARPRLTPAGSRAPLPRALPRRAPAARPALGRRRLHPSRQRARVPAHARARAALEPSLAPGSAATTAGRHHGGHGSRPRSSGPCVRRSGCPKAGTSSSTRPRPSWRSTSTPAASSEEHLEETLLKANLDAVREIVRQIRLRDLGGIIVVDFIDMEERKSRRRSCGPSSRSCARTARRPSSSR